jgi:hypothetical protein
MRVEMRAVEEEGIDGSFRIRDEVVRNMTILHYFWDRIINSHPEKEAGRRQEVSCRMKARIRIGSIHWVIVEQIEDRANHYLLAAGESFSLTGLENETYEFRINRITAQTVDLKFTGPSLALIPENKLIGEGQPRTELTLKVGESRKVATPTLDAGIVWDIHLEEII